MTLTEVLESLSKAQRAKLDYDLEQGNPAFTVVQKYPDVVIGVYLDKIDRLEVVEAQGKWAIARKRKNEG